MAHLAFHLFGQFRVVLDGQLITDFPSDKVRALLAYLVTEAPSREATPTGGSGKAHSRTTLATLLWSGYREESARTSLRQALHQLRKILGDGELAEDGNGFLLITRQTVEFNLHASFTSDVHRFSELLATCAKHPHRRRDECNDCLARLQEAVELYRGGFLSGFALNDSTPFEEWRRIKQEQFHIQLFDALTDLSRAAMYAEEYEKARKFVQRQLEMEPWREDAHRKLMRILANSGQRSAALAQFQQCQQVLKTEFGIEPDDETKALYQQIRAGNIGLISETLDKPMLDSPTQERVDQRKKDVVSEPTTSKSGGAQSQALSVLAGEPLPPLPSVGTAGITSPLLGREDQLQLLLKEVISPDKRLVTVVGLGGVGKTRLALSLAQCMDAKSNATAEIHPFTNGVFVVPLAAISNDSPDLVSMLSQAILQALNVLPSEKTLASEQLLYLLRSQAMLLILDNFEHLLAAKDFLQVLLQSAPHLHLLITSRTQLNLPSEMVVRLEGLPVPALDDDPDALNYSSVQLFLAHAHRTWSAFVGTADVLPFVVRICRIVNGMPLGIELAAYWVRHFSCAEISQTLQENLRLLENTSHAHSDRHHTLYAIFESSWLLLNSAEQHLLVCLSLFRGTFSRKAILTVSGAKLVDLASLIDKSLLQQNENLSSAGWYSLHELVRQFAAEKLAQVEPTLRKTIQERYVDYYLNWISNHTKVIRPEEQAALVMEVHHELENCRQAWTLAVRHHWFEPLSIGLSGFVYLLRTTGRLAEGEAMLESATHALSTVQDGDGDDNTRLFLQQINTNLWLERANTLYLQHRFEEAFSSAQRAVKLAEENNQPVELTRALLIYADSILYGRNSSVDYTTIAKRALTIARQHHLRHWEGKALLALATEHNELDEQVALIYMTLEIAQEENDQELEVNALTLLSGGYENHGQYAKALPYRQQLVQLVALQKNPRNLSIALLNYGGTQHFLGCYSAALASWQQALEVAQKHFLERIATNIREEIANLHRVTGRIEHAHQQIVALRHELKGNPTSLETTDFNYAQILVSYGNMDDALKITQRLIARLRTQTLNQPTYLLPSLNLLAKIHDKVGEQKEAMFAVEEILQILANYPSFAMRDVNFDLFSVYLNVYEILCKTNDQRSSAFLQGGYEKLQAQASYIDDINSRQSFLSEISANRQLIAYREQGYEHRNAEQSQLSTENISKRVAQGTIPAGEEHSNHRHNLPSQLTLFIGRQQEVVEILDFIRQSERRLVTLVGPGGIGKTRLALQTANLLTNDFSDGVFLVRLESLVDPSAIAAEIAAVVGLTIQRNQPQQELIRYLRPKKMLLLLDNFEHLLSGSLLVTELLQATEQLKILVTSREQLHIPGEQIFVVEGLPYPETDNSKSIATATSVQLFVESGQRVSPTFQLNSSTYAEVVRICRLLQGMPLALELAAAWLEVLPVAEIANEIESSVDFLNIDWRRTIPSRQQSMRAVFTWSWQLLNEGERQIFRRLSIFRGGFTREAAAKVCAASIRTLAGLAHKSLLRINDPQADAPRYQIHELLRQFAAEELATTGEIEAVASNHCEFYLSYVADREKQFRAESGVAVAEIQRELDNIRHGWMWAVDHQKIALQTNSVHSLAQFYFVTGFTTQGVQLFRYAAQHLEDAARWPATHAASEKERHSLRSSLYACQAEFLVMLGQYQEGVNFAKQGSETGQLTGNKQSEVLCKFLLAKVLSTQGDHAAAREQLLQTLVLVRSYRQVVTIEDRLVETELSILLWLGHIAGLDEQLEKAQCYFNEGLQLARLKQHRRGEVSILLNLAALETFAMGDFANAKEHYALALKISAAIGYRWGEASALLEWGDLLRLHGEYSTAFDMYQRAQSMFEQINHSLKAIYARLTMGRLYLLMGDIQNAYALLAPLAAEMDRLEESGSRQNVLFALATYEYYLHHEKKALDYIAEGLHRLGETLSPTIRTGFQLLAGHCYTNLNQEPAAAASYQLVVDHYHEKELSGFAAEAYAGLANLAFRQGNITTALHHVEPALKILSAQPQVGYDEPFFVYHTCYRVLESLQDGRAKNILEQGHRRLEQYAAHIQDEGLRCSFYENVDVHRELRAAYAELTSHSPATLPIPIP